MLQAPIRILPHVLLPLEAVRACKTAILDKPMVAMLDNKFLPFTGI
jgi:uncharacterized protein YceK